MIMGNPFQPDSASDWWNFGINVAIALATLGALLWAIVSTLRAQREAKDARAEAATLRKSNALEEKARLQARLVHVKTSWGAVLTDPRHRVGTWQLVNGSSAQITDIIWHQVDPANDRMQPVAEHKGDGSKWYFKMELGRISVLDAHSETRQETGPMVNIEGRRPATEVHFTDAFRNRWQLLPDGTLVLVEEKAVITTGAVDLAHVLPAVEALNRPWS